MKKNLEINIQKEDEKKTCNKCDISSGNLLMLYRDNHTIDLRNSMNERNANSL